MFLKKHPLQITRGLRSGRLHLHLQNGFTLIELVVTISIIAILSTIAATQLARNSEEVIAAGSGMYIKQVASAAERLTILNFNQYANSLPIAGVAIPLRPTVAELVALNRLNSGFPSGPGSMPTRQSLRIDVIPQNCPGPNCVLTALACTTAPVKLGGVDTRFDLAQTMVDVQGGGGGQSSINFGSIIRGPTLNMPNPLGNVEGIVCGSSVVDTALYQRFVTMQDTRDPDLKGPLSVAGAVNLAGNLTVVGTGTAGNFVTTGTSTAGKVQLTDVSTVNTACVTNGLLARDSTGQVLSCQSNVWKVQGDSKCVGSTADLNFLQEDGRCYNGVGNPNSPAGGDWFFVEVYRHINPANFYTVQRAYGMTGVAAGKAWLRNQQSTVSGSGWSAWALTSAAASAGSSCTPEGAMATSPTGVALICVNGQYRGMDTIIRSGTPGQACAAAGTTALDTNNNNEQLICRANPSGGGLRYMRLRDITQNLTFVQSVEVSDIAYGASGSVAKPSCTAAASQTVIPVIQLIPKAISTSDGGISIYAVDAGSAWSIYLRNGAGGLLTGSPYATAIAQVFCFFP